MQIIRQFRIDKFFDDGYDGDRPERSYVFVEKWGENFTEKQVKFHQDAPPYHNRFNGVAYAKSYYGFIAVPIYMEIGDVEGPVYRDNFARIFDKQKGGSYESMKLTEDRCLFSDGSSYPRFGEYDEPRSVRFSFLSDFIFTERKHAYGPPTMHINPEHLCKIQESICNKWALGGVDSVRLSWFEDGSIGTILVEPSGKKITEGAVPLPYGILFANKSNVLDNGFFALFIKQQIGDDEAG